ncbi:hypothetical protein B0T16DRAFT_406539 [Cercophora newfieldiana]|uniref:DUF1996 domain-containing protein n=1 Tax=Cercophora newfieldiana TaxID=92897 RepID=A0AA39YH92_9PEZI|nr:hypothetical protein B0T16DRAFT_406539 [Cercophora newfieldiana]
MTEDFSNYWTAVMFFQARNGSYTRIHQLGGLFSEESNGGMTVYYFPQTVNWEGIKIRAFAPGFRMRVGDPGNRTAWWTDQPAALLKGVTYTCLQRHDTRFTNLSWDFPMAPCPAGIMTTIPFPPCWDGKNLDSPDHRSHVAYPDEDYDKGARCPPSHPVNIPRIVMEIRWDTTPFNDPELWPVDAGRQPFLWSYGDRVGHGHHADYIFGWKGDLLQRFFDQTNCRSGDCGVLDRSSVLKSNECTKEASVKEEIDGWLDKMPGGMVADRWGWDGI